MSRSFRVLLWFLLLVFPSMSVAGEGRGYYEVGSGYKTGDFGTQTRTNLLSLDAAIGYLSPVYDVRVSMQLLFQSGGGDQTSMMAMSAGAGDVVVRGGRVLVPETGAGYSLDAALAVKLPVASGASLGTGEADYGAFIGAHKRFDLTRISLLTGYIKVGDPPSIDYNDVYLYGVGISRIFADTELYAYYEGRRAVVPDTSNPQELGAGFFHMLSADYAIKGSAFRGLTNGGPDFGSSLGFVSWF